MTEKEMIALNKMSNKAYSIWQEILNAKEALVVLKDVIGKESPVVVRRVGGSDPEIELHAEDYRDQLLPMLESAVARLEREFAELKVQNG